MSDYYWPSATPNATHISYVTQVKYTVHPTSRGYFEVKATNTRINVTENRTSLPAYYVDHFIKFLFRFNLCIRLWNTYHNHKTQTTKKRLPRLLRIMCHLDNVGESIIRPSLGVPKKEIKDWRCKNFEEYLVTEYLLGRHDPKPVQDFRCVTRTNIERVPLDGLGIYNYHRPHVHYTYPDVRLEDVRVAPHRQEA